MDVSATCGSCTAACTLPNATASCGSGICQILACNPGFGNCDSIASNGCESLLLTTNSRNCGACGHDCQGGTCSGGKCQPVVLAQGEPHLGGLAVDATSVYWVNEEGFGFGSKGAVKKTSLLGGATPYLADSQAFPVGIAVSATEVYWTNAGDGTVGRAPLSGGTAAGGALGQSKPWGIAVDGTSVYWTNYMSPAGSVMKAPLGGGPTTTVASAQAYPSNIAVDPTAVYWTAEGGTTGISSVLKIALGGGAVTTLASNQPGLRGLAVDATNAYWGVIDFASGTGVGAVMTVPKFGGTPTALWRGSYQEVSDVVVDSANVYWLVRAPYAGWKDYVMRMPLNGGAPEFLVNLGAGTFPGHVIADATSIYWTMVGDGTNGKIMKVAK